jgi:DNA-binding transcriptional ArsR family regulator
MTFEQSGAAQVRWDFGTAYELFISLHVLHSPEFYGVRASWAAGVRSRIPAAQRRLLEETLPFTLPPLAWLQHLPHPKDAASVIEALGILTPAERTRQLFLASDSPDPELVSLLEKIAQSSSWGHEDVQAIRKIMAKKDKARYSEEKIRQFLNWWMRPDELGEGFLNALNAYHQAFFEQEERRVAPVLQAGLERAQKLAKNMNTLQLLTELSQGVQFNENVLQKNLIIAPAYWTTPLVIYRNLDENHMLILFGARPASMSDIPGELVPDDLLRKLKVLADPTRLKILRYLSHEELMPSELARRLHLRAPTVTHHLSELRLAGLVNLRLQGQEKRYTARQEALRNTFEVLDIFLNATADQNSD